MDKHLLGKPCRKWFSEQWPHIARYLREPEPSGWVEDKFANWSRYADELSPADRAAGYEEWADFYEWRLVQRADELARDPGKRHLVEEWTDSMAYCCRRSAVFARGGDPGEWISDKERRPDLPAKNLAITAQQDQTAVSTR